MLLTRCHLIIWIMFLHNCPPIMWWSTCNFPQHYIPIPGRSVTGCVVFSYDLPDMVSYNIKASFAPRNPFPDTESYTLKLLSQSRMLHLLPGPPWHGELHPQTIIPSKDASSLTLTSLTWWATPAKHYPEQIFYSLNHFCQEYFITITEEYWIQKTGT